MEQREKNDQQEISWSNQIYNIVRDVAVQWHRILLTGIIVAIIADVFLTLTYVPSYRAEVSVVREQTYTTDINSEESEEIAEALGYIVSSNVFLDMIKEELGVEELEGYFRISTVSGTNIMTIVAEAKKPLTAYQMLSVMMAHYEEVASLVIGDTKLNLLNKIQVPVEPYNQINHSRNFLIYGGIGMIAMVALCAFFSYTKDTIKEKRDIKNKLQIRLLADIASESKISFKHGRFSRKKAVLVTQMSTSFEFVENFKRLRIRFEVQARKNDYKTIVVNSIMENEGKSSVIVNLAVTLAKQRRKVLAIDLDIGKPALHKLMEIQVEHGIEEVLKGQIDMSEAIYYDPKTNIQWAFVKNSVAGRAELLENGVLEAWLKQHRDDYDYILIDTPPINYMSDAMVVSQYADAVLLVVCQNYVPTAVINRKIDHYQAQDTPIMGCVLNRTLPARLKKRKWYRYKGGADRGTE